MRPSASTVSPRSSPDTMRAEVAEADADARQPAAHVRACHVRQQGVVVDEGGLEAEVRDREEQQSEADVDESDEGGRHDARDREDQEVPLAAAGPITLRAEHRRDDGVERHRCGGRHGEQQGAGPLAEGADRPRAHREADDGEAEDRVREVVQRPRQRLRRAARARESTQPAPPGGGCHDRHPWWPPFRRITGG